MVNVNKNIVPGKQAESVAKNESQAQARRPRNQKLNSSKKLPDSIKNRRKQKLNCSREQVIDQLVNEEGIYSMEEAEEVLDAFEEQTGATVERLATMDEVDERDGEFWATKDGRTTLWCRGNGMWYDSGISDAESDASTATTESRKSSAPGNLLTTRGVSGTITEELPEVKNTFEAWLQEADQKYGLNLGIESWYISDDGTLNIEYTDANDYEGTDQQAFLDDYLDFVVNTVVPAAAGKSKRVQIVGGPDGYYNEWDTSSDMNSSCDSSKKQDMDSKLNSSESDSWETYYTRMSPEQFAKYYSIPIDDIIEENNLVEQNGYGKVVAHLVIKPEYESKLDAAEFETLDVLDNGTIGYTLGGSQGRGVRFYSADLDEITDRINHGNLNSGCHDKLNSSESGETVTITTESGNEVSLSDIQIIQDPNTNEIALFIQEDPDEAIPEGFTVIGVASQPALPAVDGEGAVCPECGQDPCVCEGGENLDSSANPRQS